MNLTVDGIALNALAWNIKNRGGRWSVPGSPASNISVPARHGSIWTPNKTFEEGSLVFSMWVNGALSNGTMPADRAQQVRNNIDSLTRLFAKRHGLLEVVQTDNLAVARRCYAECIQTIDFSSTPGHMAEFAVELKVPSAFWEDVNPQTHQTSAGIAAGSTFGLTQLDGGTAIIQDATFTVRGAATNPRLTDPTTEQWVQLNAAVVSLQDWVLNSGTWSSTNNAVNVAGTTDHGGSARLLQLTPNPVTGAITLRVDGSGFNANTRLTVTGRRKWLIA